MSRNNIEEDRFLNVTHGEVEIPHSRQPKADGVTEHPWWASPNMFFSPRLFLWCGTLSPGEQSACILFHLVVIITLCFPVYWYKNTSRNEILYSQMVRDLTDPERSLCGKNKDASLELKRKGNQCFLNKDYAMALTCYSEVSQLILQSLNCRYG